MQYAIAHLDQDGKADCDQRDADHRSGQQVTALRTDGLPVLGILRRGITLPQTAVQQKQDAALRNGDGAVEQELKERHLDQQAGAGQRHHGSGVLEPDAQNDRVQRCQYAPERRTAERFQRSRSSAVRKIRCRTNPTLSRTACHRLRRSRTNRGSTSAQERNNRTSSTTIARYSA